MKKILSFLFVAAFSLQTVTAALSPAKSTTPVATVLDATSKSKKEAERFLMEKISKMTIKDYETIRGKKLNFFEKISFKATQKRIKKD